VTPTSQTDSNLNPEQPVALSLLSVEERLLLINASIPLQGLSRLQKLVLAVSMQVFCTSVRAPFELTRAPTPPFCSRYGAQVWIFPKGTEIARCEENATGIFLLIRGSARSYPGAPALYSKLPNASFDLETMQVK
jgi:hypothetical protein